MWTPLLINFDIGPESNIAPSDTRAHCSRLWQGSDFESGFTVVIDELPVDFSASELTFRLFDPAKSSILISLSDSSNVSGSSLGVVSLKIPAATSSGIDLPTATRQVNGFSLCDLWYCIDATKADGSKIRVSQGTFVVSQDVNSAN